MKSSGELLENVNVNGYQYGVSLQGLNDALKKGIDCVIVLEPDGANILEKYCKKNNIVNIKVYVNNPIPVLLDRLKTRLKEDKNASQGDYKDRLFNIVFFEPENWTEKALNGEHNYDLIFQTFDQNNINEENRLPQATYMQKLLGHGDKDFTTYHHYYKRQALLRNFDISTYLETAKTAMM